MPHLKASFSRFTLPSLGASMALFGLVTAVGLVMSCSSADQAETPGPAVVGDQAASDVPQPDADSTAPSNDTAAPPPGITVFAGNGGGIFEGDGGPALDASVFGPDGLAVDADGNLYISTDNRVRMVDFATGVITTLAGTGSPGFGGDGEPAIEARLKSPEGLALDGDGNIFIADTDNGRVRRIDGETGVITTFAGGGIPKRVNGIIDPGDGGAATDAFFKNPKDVTVDGAGNVYFTASNRVRKVDANGVITTLAGSGLDELSGDGGPSTSAGIADPRGLTVDEEGNIYFADTYNQRVRRIDGATGIITTVAGIGHHPPQFHPEEPIKPEGQGFSGDGGPATSAMLFSPNGVVIGPDGNLYIADTGNDKVRKVDLATGVITTIADGGSVTGERMETGFSQSGEFEVTFKNFAPPVAIAVTDDGVFYIADQQRNKVIRMVP